MILPKAPPACAGGAFSIRDNFRFSREKTTRHYYITTEEESMPKNMMILNEAAKAIGVKPYQLVYALTSGAVPEPSLRISNKRIFQPADIRRLKTHFAKHEQKGEK